MCGIFGYIGKRNNAPELVLAGLKSLEYRGYDSWGIAVANSKFKAAKIIIKKKAGKIGDATISDLPQGNIALGHTRWATHGGVTDINAHPHLDCTNQLAIIHNGIIENYDELKEELVRKGHEFISETDTEVAVHLIEDNYNKLKANNRSKEINKLFLESVRVSFNRFIGLNAIIVMNAETQSFVAAKNGSPLVIGIGSGGNFLASDAHALLPYTRDVYFMEDDQVVLVSQTAIEVIRVSEGRIIQPKYTNLNWHQVDTVKGKYAHFMLKEIYDQPVVLEHITHTPNSHIVQLSDLIRKSYGSYLVGCGTAAYACLAGTYIFSTIAKKHVNFAVGSEFGYLVDFLTPKSFVLALSQSGETIDVIETVKKAKAKGATIGSIVNVVGSTLNRMSDISLSLDAGIEKAVVSTKAFTAKLAYLLLLANYLNGSGDKAKRILSKAVQSVRTVLTAKNIRHIHTIVQKVYKKDHMYVIGRGISYPIALETALKIKEASYIHAEGFAAGELKHGVIALIEKGTPCIAFLLNDDTYGANLAGAMELKARGGYIIGISFKPHEIFDYYLPIEDCGIASIIPSVIIGQLLGYYLAVARGFDPDKPRNLAKSVTVK